MKKALALFLTLVLLAGAGLCVAHVEVDSTRDAVSFQQDVFYGDPAAAYGATVECDTSMNYHLFWNTVCPIEETLRPTTEFRFSQSPDPVFGDFEPSGIDLAGFSIRGLHDYADRPKEELTGLEVAFRELFDETGAGEEKERTIRIGDYCDFYPVEYEISIPGCSIGYREYDLDREEERLAQLRPIHEGLQEFLKIPVLPEETLDIHVRRHEDGQYGGGGYGSTENDSYDLWCRDVLTEDAMYFVINNRTKKDQVIDTSHIPGGYGIYCLPYHESKRDESDPYGYGSVEIETLSMVYSLPHDLWSFQLNLTEDQKQLQLLTVEQDGTCVLTVINLATMETVQRLECFRLQDVETPTIWTVWWEEDHIALETSDNKVAVLERKENGEYTLAFVTDLRPERPEGEEVPYYLDSRDVTDWDGEKLIFCGETRRYNGYDESERAQEAGFCLGVYNKQGLQYYGEYLSSLESDTTYDMYYNDLCRMVEDGLRVRWNR